jgi:hypothetical protein
MTTCPECGIPSVEDEAPPHNVDCARHDPANCNTCIDMEPHLAAHFIQPRHEDLFAQTVFAIQVIAGYPPAPCTLIRNPYGVLRLDVPITVHPREY